MFAIIIKKIKFSCACICFSLFMTAASYFSLINDQSLGYTNNCPNPIYLGVCICLVYIFNITLWLLGSSIICFKINSGNKSNTFATLLLVAFIIVCLIPLYYNENCSPEDMEKWNKTSLRITQFYGPIVFIHIVWTAIYIIASCVMTLKYGSKIWCKRHKHAEEYYELP